MKKVLLLTALVVVMVLVALALTSPPTRALPEYSTQTGEPCATCHVSPSGGGLRTPRGQAWVGSGKPGAVVDLTEALAVLGVHLEVNAADYAAPAKPVAPAEPLHLKAGQAAEVHQWLRDYEGN